MNLTILSLAGLFIFGVALTGAFGGSGASEVAQDATEPLALRGTFLLVAFALAALLTFLVGGAVAFSM